MRTTLKIDDQLYRRAKQAAAEGQCSVTSLIEEGLRVVLEARQGVEERAPVRLTVVAGRGLQPGVDLDDTAAMQDLTEG